MKELSANIEYFQNVEYKHFDKFGNIKQMFQENELCRFLIKKRIQTMDETALWTKLLQIEAELDRRCLLFQQRCKEIRQRYQINKKKLW
jgi:hypothetical protein